MTFHFVPQKSNLRIMRKNSWRTGNSKERSISFTWSEQRRRTLWSEESALLETSMYTHSQSNNSHFWSPYSSLNANVESLVIDQDVSFERVNDATVKLDRIMECVLDTTGADDSEGAPAVSQPNYEWRPPTRDLGGLERRLGRMEENVASIFETVKTLVDLLHNQRVWNGNILYLQRNYVQP